MDGVLIVDKPIGPTSHDVVTQVRRAVGVRRVGHTGTLDPMATGVLPVMIGRVTRLARFLAAGRKVYEATIRLGYATDTYDATGRQLDRDEWDGSRPAREATEISEEGVRQALDQFRGTFAQQPPAFSAKKVGGVRAYRLARRARALGLRGSLGIEGAKGTVRPAAVYVTVYDLSLVELTPGRLVVHLVCSPGFYVRSLAHDLGVTLGCGGHLEALRRLASGEFTLADAVPLAKVIEAEDVSAWIRPAQDLLHWLPVATLTEDGAKRAIHGQEVRATDITRREAGQPSESPPTEVEDAAVRLTTPDGQLLGLGRADEGHEGALHPLVVLV